MPSRRLPLLFGLVCCVLSVSLSACRSADDAFCGTAGCEFSKGEWTRLQSLANLPDPLPDSSNRYVGNPAAIFLGQKWYFDARFSGNATQLDTLKRATQYARAPKGQPTNLSCASCHNPQRGGSDDTSSPGNVSIGAGEYDVRSQKTLNSAYYSLTYWNGRNDSLWAQILAVNESFVSMNSTRLHDAWTINDHYVSDYTQIFSDYPWPLTGSSKDLPQTSDGFGQCATVAGACPAPCRAVTSTGNPATGEPSHNTCWPRFPANGKPGAIPGCQAGDLAGTTGPSAEPFNDAFDCMDSADKTLVNRIYVNWAKAIAAYEYTLLSRNASFDRFINEGSQSGQISDAAKRGARLFVGKASCIDCHNTPLLSDNLFHNIGVPQIGPGVPTESDCPAGGSCDCVNGKNCLPWGAYDGLKKLQANSFRRDSIYSDSVADRSRASFYTAPLTDDLKGAWRTPGLRDVALTAPYMHNGVIRSLEEVIWHYDKVGSADNMSGTRDVRLHPLELTDQEQTDLVEFLRTLTGEPLSSSVTGAPVLPL